MDEFMEENKKNQVAAEIYFPQEDPILPQETAWVEGENWHVLFSLIDQEMLNRNVAKAEIDIYTRWNNTHSKQEDWTFDSHKTYLNLFSYPEYMFLETSSSIMRNHSDICNRLCIHIPSGIKFQIFRRNYINFSEKVAADKRNIFYKFSYTGENGMVTPMIIHTITAEVKDDEQIRHIKYDILKNGAKWFCDHLTDGLDGALFGNNPKKFV
jgi:hypothetical protein